VIRYLFYLLIFLLGLASAAVFLGEMRHLRQAAPGPLPGWTEAIADEARVPEGRAQIALGLLPLGSLEWDSMAARLDGLHWQLRLLGPGLAAQAVLRVPYWPQEGHLQSGRGRLEFQGTRYEIASIEGVFPMLSGADEGLLQITLAPGTQIDPSLAQMLGAVAELDGLTLRVPFQVK
jgi:hypothetical protein